MSELRFLEFFVIHRRDTDLRYALGMPDAHDHIRHGVDRIEQVVLGSKSMCSAS